MFASIFCCGQNQIIYKTLYLSTYITKLILSVGKSWQPVRGVPRLLLRTTLAFSIVEKILKSFLGMSPAGNTALGGARASELELAEKTSCEGTVNSHSGTFVIWLPSVPVWKAANQEGDRALTARQSALFNALVTEEAVFQ